MTWYNPKTWGSAPEEKLNPAQSEIAQDEGYIVTSDGTPDIRVAFDTLEVLNRGTNMVVSGCSSLDYDVKDKKFDGVVNNVRAKQLHNLLNYRPNPYQSQLEFRTAIFTDFILEGNFFVYFDGAFLYHVPAVDVEIVPDKKTRINSFKFHETTFKPDEMFQVRDLSSTSVYRGSSRLISARRSISLLKEMHSFQEGFFRNSAVPGMVLTTDNTLSEVAKERTINRWSVRYNPSKGGKRPMILDSGLKPNPLMNLTFQEMDFDTSIKTHGVKILQALGVPPVLLDGGNQANISPNLRLLYLETVMPILDKFVSAVELFFGYDISAVTTNVSALQPELRDVAAYHASLVNGGILSPNEARAELRYPPKPGAENDDLRIPANIAGSAANPDLGGAPKKPAAEPK